MNDVKPHVIVFDGLNFIHRARSGFQRGPAPIVFNFFRSLGAEIKKHEPTRILFVLEGSPQRQMNIDPHYKANRRVEETDPLKIESKKSFLRQKDVIVSLLKEHFPVSVMQHNDFEGDDLVFNVVKRSTRAVPFTVISTDTDFIQLLEIDNVKLYDPVKKMYAEKPSYNYAAWKALRGDLTDNVPRIISDSAAELMTRRLEDIDLTKNTVEERTRFAKNYELIKFKEFTDDETFNVRSWQGSRDWDAVKKVFESYYFKSIVNDESWPKFVNVFDPLFGSIQ